MSLCETCSDRMPVVASGRSEWSSTELAHVTACRDCAAEWALVVSVARLGRDVTVDAAGVAPRVLERVRAGRRADRRRHWARRSALLGGLAVAAVLLLVVVPRRPAVTPVQPGPRVVMAVPAELQLAELDGAVPSELEAVLTEFDGPVVPGSSLDGPDVEGLDASQVERALRSWEES